MMPILNDICRCWDPGCPDREACARWVHRYHGGERTPNAYTLFPPDADVDDPCPSFIPARTETE